VRPIPWKITPSAGLNSLFRVVGYPGDLPKDNEKLKGQLMHQSQCNILAYDLEDNDYQLKYLLDTHGG
jgi:hypothetical protein